MNAAASLSVGSRVFHERFGDGDVIGSDDLNRLVVKFDKVGDKRVVPAFLEKRHSAEIIAFPTSRIVRLIEHGRGVVAQNGKRL
jgi:hypothetical protein